MSNGKLNTDDKSNKIKYDAVSEIKNIANNEIHKINESGSTKKE